MGLLRDPNLSWKQKFNHLLHGEEYKCVDCGKYVHHEQINLHDICDNCGINKILRDRLDEVFSTN